MTAFELTTLLDRHRHTGGVWSEFLRVQALSMGIYTLPAGSTDPQHPHTEDEVYYVVAGRAQIRVDKEDQPVQPGSIVYVAATVEHHFHSIAEDLALLVFFAPAEGTTNR